MRLLGEKLVWIKLLLERWNWGIDGAPNRFAAYGKGCDRESHLCVEFNEQFGEIILIKMVRENLSFLLKRILGRVLTGNKSSLMAFLFSKMIAQSWRIILNKMIHYIRSNEKNLLRIGILERLKNASNNQKSAPGIIIYNGSV